MAQHDMKIFEEFADTIGKKLVNLDTDTLKLGLVTTAYGSVGASTASPTWSDFSGAEVSGSGYSAGGATVASNSLVEASGVSTFDASNVTWSQTSAGPADVRTAILYSSTAASSNAIAAVDIGSAAVSLVNGDITVAWHASGIITMTPG